MIGRLPRVHVRGVDAQLVLVDDLDAGADVLENLAHDVDVGNVGDVGEGSHAGSHDGGGHELERRVLGTLDVHLAGDAMSPLDLNDFHAASVHAN